MSSRASSSFSRSSRISEPATPGCGAGRGSPPPDAPPPHVSSLAPRFLVGGAAVALVTAVTGGLGRRGPAGRALWASYCVRVARMGGLVRGGPQLVASRYSYLPCLGWAVL